MELSRMFMVCAVVVLTLSKVHTVPVPGFLSGFYGGHEARPQPQPAPLDINQLLRQYYTAQSEDQLPGYNPFGALNSPMSFGQGGTLNFAQKIPYGRYPALAPVNPYQGKFILNSFGEPYANLGVVLPNAANDGQPLDSLLAKQQEPSPYGDLAKYRNLDLHNPSAEEAAPKTEAAKPADSQATVAAHIELSDNSPASKPLVPASAADSSNVTDQSNDRE